MESLTFFIIFIIFISTFLSFIVFKLLQNYQYTQNDISYLESKGKSEKLILALNNILSKNPNNDKIRLKLASVYENLGMLQEACTEYTSLTNTHLDDYGVSSIDIIKKIDELYSKLNDKETAFRFFLTLYKDSPNNRPYTKYMGINLLKEGSSSFAKTYLEILLPTEDLEVLYALAYITIKMRDYNYASRLVETIYNLMLKKNLNKTDIENLLVTLLVKSEKYHLSKKLLENILSVKSSHKDFFINRIYLYILYKLNDKKSFINQYNIYKKLDVKEYFQYDFNLDLTFYSYFLECIDKSIEYFNLLETEFNEGYPETNKNKHKSIEFLRKMQKIDIEYNAISKKLINSNRSKELLKSVIKKYKNYVTDEEREAWDSSIAEWENLINAGTLHYVDQLFNINPTFDIQRVIKEEKFKLKEGSNVKEVKKSISQVENIINIPFQNFTTICQNIIRYKLMYFIEQEILSEDNKNGDEVNYLAYPQRSSRTESTLIGFRRWKSKTIGELVLRDFILSIHENKAKNGILFIPVELSESAQNYASNNTILKVYSKWQFNSFLSGMNSSKF